MGKVLFVLSLLLAGGLFTNSLRAAPKMNIKCYETVEGSQKRLIWVRFGFLSTTPARSIVKVMKPYERDGKLWYNPNSYSMTAVAKKQEWVPIKQGENDHFILERPDYNKSVRLSFNADYSEVSASLIEDEEDVQKISTLTCEKHDIEGELSADGLGLLLEEVTDMMRLGFPLRSCKLFQQYKELQAHILETEREQMEWWQDRNITASQERNKYLNEFCDKVIEENAFAMYNNQEIANALDLLDVIAGPYGWE